MGEAYGAELIEPLVKRGLFDTPESAIVELAEDYVLRQVHDYQETITSFENRYGMTYQQFNRYLQHRTTILESDTLSSEQARSLGQAIMLEEEDALEWKIAREMLQSWLGLRREVGR